MRGHPTCLQRSLLRAAQDPKRRTFFAPFRNDEPARPESKVSKVTELGGGVSQKAPKYRKELPCSTLKETSRGSRQDGAEGRRSAPDRTSARCRQGFGTYAFIPDAGFVGTVFVNAMSNLLGTQSSLPSSLQLRIQEAERQDLEKIRLVTMARDVVVTLKPVEGAQLSSRSTPF